MTYEDFVVGLAPEPGGEGLRFRVRAGSLLHAVELAQQCGDKRVLLQIDEINRGDLGKVLGEAIYLLEPREVGGELPRRVALPHAWNGGASLELPPNLYVLGTMNTADRSIAGLGLAGRRPFAFLTLHPDRTSRSGVSAIRRLRGEPVRRLRALRGPPTLGERLGALGPAPLIGRMCGTPAPASRVGPTARRRRSPWRWQHRPGHP